MMKTWSRVNNYLLRIIVGLSYEVKGLDNLPNTPAIFVCKHQAAWETVFFVALLDKISIIYKKELHFIPIAGSYLKYSNMLSLDRSLGHKELPKLLSDGADVVSNDYSILVFPEGTRSKPMEMPPFKSGFKYFAKKLKIPIVPVALNSGVFWQRRRFTIFSGVVTVKFLPAIELETSSEDDIIEYMHKVINEESINLIDENLGLWYNSLG